MAEYNAGHLSEAIALVRADCKASWFHPLWQYLICFCHDDIEFIYPDGTKKHHNFGTAFVYLGPNEDKFASVFSQFGTVVRRITPTT